MCMYDNTQRRLFLIHSFDDICFYSSTFTNPSSSKQIALNIVSCLTTHAHYSLNTGTINYTVKLILIVIILIEIYNKDSKGICVDFLFVCIVSSFYPAHYSKSSDSNSILCSFIL